MYRGTAGIFVTRFASVKSNSLSHEMTPCLLLVNNAAKPWWTCMHYQVGNSTKPTKSSSQMRWRMSSLSSSQVKLDPFSKTKVIKQCIGLKYEEVSSRRWFDGVRYSPRTKAESYKRCESPCFCRDGQDSLDRRLQLNEKYVRKYLHERVIIFYALGTFLTANINIYLNQHRQSRVQRNFGRVI